MTQVSQGNLVRVHYTGRFEDGTVFDSSSEGEPLEFVAGSHQVIPGVSNAVVGMAEGEKKTVTIPPEEAYGPHNPRLEQTVSRDQLPEETQEGDQLRAIHGDQEIAVWVRQLDVDTAVIDANHPLAGHTLVFDLEVVSVEAGGA